MDTTKLEEQAKKAKETFCYCPRGGGKFNVTIGNSNLKNDESLGLGYYHPCPHCSSDREHKVIFMK